MKDHSVTSGANCRRHASSKDVALSQSGFGGIEIGCLTVVRRFCQSFAAGPQDSWMEGFLAAEEIWGRRLGPQIAHMLMRFLREVRQSRRSVFVFSAPDCPTCAQIITEHERRLISAIQFTRQGRPEQARLQLMMLCEGRSTHNIMQALDDLIFVLSDNMMIA
jgi:hypothetical protein